MAHVLEIEDLTVSYGHLQVLFGVSLHVDANGAVALLGTNGAGKSTVLRAAAGLIPVGGGRVRFDGEDVTGWPTDRLARRGLILVEGGRAMFPSLTVRESLRLGAYPVIRDAAEVDRRIEVALAAFPELVALLHRPTAALSGGEQQMLAIGRAVVARPRLLAIDELSLGLAPVVLQRLLAVVADLREQGVSVLLVEQSLNVAIAITETAYFLEKGEVRFQGPTGDLADRGDLVRSVFFGAPSAQGIGAAT